GVISKPPSTTGWQPVLPKSALERPNLVILAPRAKKSPMPKTKTKTATGNLYAVMGSDESEVKRVASDLATSLTPPEAGDFGLEIVDGVAENADQAAARIRSTIEALQTLPFFGSTKVVWLKSANFLGDTQLSCATSVQFALEELSDLIENGLGSDVIFLIRATEGACATSYRRSCPGPGAAFQGGCHIRVKQCAGDTRPGTRAETCATIIGSRRKRHRYFAGRDRANSPQFVTRQRFDGTSSP